ncbi:MAG: Type phosphodiesterase/nucleotide pyrophosphatase [Verrucomicrobiales bacterium]|nr:Type phosphodiesterase/nucleotide pyrophosphatase [Verrucomicrobiales bacterium]
MKPILPLFVFIDACGWEIIRHDPFARSLAPNRKRLDSVFGYSSACVPSILSGAWPDQHRNWCYFVYDPEHSPFKLLRPFQLLPQKVTSRRIFRRWLSKSLKRPLSFRGYFDLYNIPFRHISLFDFTEKKSPLKPGGMNRGDNIFDFLERRGIRYHVSDPDQTELANMEAAICQIASEQIDFAFVYWPDLDGLLHRVGNKSQEIPLKLRLYEQRLERLLAVAQDHYEEVRLYVFSDHGMANCDIHLDLKSKIEALGLKWKEDYVVVYDSTMARFWFFNDRARQTVMNCLNQVHEGRIIPDQELKDLRAFFPDRYFGELIFLVKEGVLIVPSHMGERPIRAMHGYHPNDPQSYASLLTNQPNIPADVTAIPHVFNLMTRDAEEANRENAKPRPPTFRNQRLVEEMT